MPFERCCRKGLCKAVSEHCGALDPIDGQFSILYQSAYMVVHDIDVLCSILALGVFFQGKARFIVAEHLHLSDRVFW